MKQVSVIVPCYNQALYLKEALNSVLAQTYTAWECIIVNDDSPDNTEEISFFYCKKDHRFKYIKKENGGLSSSRNEGIRNASGLYIVALDADDKLEPLYLEKCVQRFEENYNISIVYTEATKFDFINEKWDLQQYTFERLMFTNMIFCSAMYKKADWERIGGYDESITQGMEDWEFWIRLLDKNSVVVRIPQELFCYRVKEKSMFKQMEMKNFDQVYWKAIKKNFELYANNFPSPQRLYIQMEWLQETLENQSKKRSVLRRIVCKIKSMIK